MKDLSPHERKLVSALERDATLSERLLGRARTDIAILTELASIAAPSVVPHLLPFVFGSDRSVARAAAGVLRRALDAATQSDLADIEGALRRRWWSFSSSPDAWWTLQPIVLSRFNQFGGDESAVAGLATFHPNGYVREAAVTRLDALAGDRVLLFLLMRVNDWVTPVAQCASDAVARRLTPSYAGEFFDNLPLLFKLARSERRAHADLIGQVYSLLRAPEQAAVLDRGLRSENRATRRVAFRLARESARANDCSLLELALADADTAIRHEAVVETRHGLAVNELRLLLPRIVSDPFPYIRSEGLSIASDRLDGVANEWLLSALLDRNLVVRDVARVSLRQHAAAIDFPTFYRDALRAARSPHEHATAVLGLGETGSRADVTEIVPFLRYDIAAVRRAAMRAVTRLDLEEMLPHIIVMLSDAAPSVSASARQVLRAHASAVGADALRSVLRTAPYGHSRRNAVSVAASLSKWESLPILLEGAASQDATIKQTAFRWLARWMERRNRIFNPPTAGQLEALRVAFDCYHHAIDAASAAELRAILRDWTASAR